MANQKEHVSCHLIPAAIGKPALRALISAGLSNLEMISQVKESDVLALHGVGPKAIRILKSAMLEAGIDWY